MALVTTTGSLIRQYNAFTGLSASERSASGIARAELVYYSVNDNWPAAGSGNNRLYQTGQISLPKDFGYVLTDAFVKIDAGVDDSLSVEMVGHGRIYPGGVLGPQINFTLQADPSLNNSAGNQSISTIGAANNNTNYPSLGGEGAIVYSMRTKPTAVIYPFGAKQYTSTVNPASIWEWAIGEQEANNTTAYDVSAYFRFLQYDIDQSYNYIIQSPQLTR